MPGSSASSDRSFVSLASSFQTTYYGDPNLFGNLTPEATLRAYLRTGVLFSFPHHMRTAASAGDTEATLILADYYVRSAVGDLSTLEVDPPSLVHDLCSPADVTVMYRDIAYQKVFSLGSVREAPTLLFHTAVEAMMASALRPHEPNVVLNEVVERSRVPIDWVLPFIRVGIDLMRVRPATTEALYSLLGSVYSSRPRSLPRTRGCTRKLLLLLSKVGFEIYHEAWTSLAPEDLVRHVEELTTG